VELQGGLAVVVEKRGNGKTRYGHGSCAHQVTRVSSGRFQFFVAECSSPAVHTMAMFSAGGGSLSLMLEVDGFGFT
jgi:hypothetical protein